MLGKSEMQHPKKRQIIFLAIASLCLAQAGLSVKFGQPPRQSLLDWYNSHVLQTRLPSTAILSNPAGTRSTLR